MDKLHFSPALIIGFGTKAEEIVSQTHKLMSHWSSARRKLIQTVIAKSPVGLGLSLQAAVDTLKDAALISEAELEAGLYIRRDSGPMEINVFLLGEIGTVLDGLCLDNILRGVINLRFAWGTDLGFTGANITSVGLVTGKQTPSRLVLQRMLELYKSEEFLDSFGGRIFVVGNSLRDGSRIGWQDLSLALARVIYLSINPGNEPLLLPQLGLIRKYEREAKLATLGVTCFEQPREDLAAGIKYLEAMSNTDPISLSPVSPAGKALLAELDQLQTRDRSGSGPQLCEKLRQGVEEMLAAGNPIASNLLFINMVQTRISAQPDERVEISNPVLSRVDKRVNLHRRHEGFSPLPVLMFGLVILVVVYNIAYRSTLAGWSVWSITGLIALALLSLGVRVTRGSGQKNHREVEMESEPCTSEQEVFALESRDIEELRAECRRTEINLRRLNRVYLQAAKELKLAQTEDCKRTHTGVLNKQLAGKAKGEDQPWGSSWLLPAEWQEMGEEHLRKYLTQKIIDMGLSTENKCWDLGPQELQMVAKVDPEPLLVFRESGSQIRKISLIAAKVPNPSDFIEERGLVEGEEGLICIVNLFLGLDPQLVVLNL